MDRFLKIEKLMQKDYVLFSNVDCRAHQQDYTLPCLETVDMAAQAFSRHTSALAVPVWAWSHCGKFFDYATFRHRRQSY